MKKIIGSMVFSIGVMASTVSANTIDWKATSGSTAWATGTSWGSAGWAAAAGILVLGAGYLLFELNLWGAGDAKLAVSVITASARSGIKLYRLLRCQSVV